MRDPNSATLNATAKPSKAALWIRILKNAIDPSKTATGKAATRVESQRFPNGS